MRRNEGNPGAAARVMDQPLVIMDRLGFLVFASAPFAALSGHSTEDLVGKSFVGLFEGSGRDAMHSRLAKMPSRCREEFRADLVPAGGRPLPVEVALERLVSERDARHAWWAVVREVAAKAKEPALPPRDEAERLSCAMLDAQEAERKRIAADLHDGLGQMLSAVKFGLQSASHSIGDRASQDVRATIDGLVSTVKEALEEVRRISMNLRPSTLDDLGLVAALSWFMREFGSIYRHIRLDTEFLVAESDVDESLRLPLFRVVQEAMNNVAKHSRATRVWVRLECGRRHLRLTIVDDGVGFDPAEVNARKGAEKPCGHICSRERVESSGGTFVLESAPGRGVSVTALWPSRSAGAS